MALGLIPGRSPLGAFYRSPLGVRAFAEDGTPITGWYALVSCATSSYVYGRSKTPSAQMLVSSDNGVHYETFPAVVATARMSCSGDGRVVVLTPTHNTWYISTDYGQTWSGNRYPHTGSNPAVSYVTALSNDGSYIYVGGSYYSSGSITTFWRSQDYGQTWTNLGTTAYNGQPTAHCSTNGQIVMFWTQSGPNVYVSTNYGAGLSNVLSSPVPIGVGGAISPDGQYMMISWNYVTYFVLKISCDYGASWSTTPNWNIIPNVNYTSCGITDSYSGTRRLYFTQAWKTSAPVEQRTYVSTDGGSNWTRLYPESAYEDVDALLSFLVANQYGTNVLTAGAARGISRTRNFGSTWTATGFVP